MTVGALVRRSGRRVSVVMAVIGLAVATVSVVATGGASAAPANAAALPPRVTGLEVVVGETDLGSDPARSAYATCPAGKQVVGGGAWIWGGPAALTRLEPFRNSLTGRYSYLVTAAAVGPAPVSEWTVDAFAFCADPIPGYGIVPRTSNWSTGDVLTADPVCPDGKRVLGSGARIQWPTGQPHVGVGLQVARADERGVLVRTQARRAAAGQGPTEWQLTGFAICADPPLGYRVITGRSSEEASEDLKSADADCPLMRLMSHLPLQRTRLLSVGGAITNVAPGNVALYRLMPLWGPDGLSDHRGGAVAVENTPTNADWDFIVVRTICVY
jgi:hypothetical protein